MSKPPLSQLAEEGQYWYKLMLWGISYLYAGFPVKVVYQANLNYLECNRKIRDWE